MSDHPKLSGTHDGLPVAGYRPQSSDRVATVNENKTLEEMVLRQLDKLVTSKECDGRWLALGRTHLELAFMAINRAVFQPTRVTLPGDQV